MNAQDVAKELSQKYFPAIAKLFRSAMPVASTSEAFYLLEGLEALSTNRLGKVMDIFVDDLVVDVKSGGTFNVRFAGRGACSCYYYYFCLSVFLFLLKKKRQWCTSKSSDQAQSSGFLLLRLFFFCLAR